MTRWNISVSPSTDRLVRVFLARSGMKKGDLSAFVDEAVRAEVLRRSAARLRERDPALSDTEAAELASSLAAIEQGLDEMRAGKGRPAAKALREIAESLGVTPPT